MEQPHALRSDGARRAGMRPAPEQEADPHPLLGLQRRAGNAAVSRLIVQRDADDEADQPSSSEDAEAAPMGFNPSSILSDMASGTVTGGDQAAPWDDTGLGIQAQRAARVTLQRDPPAAPGDTSSTTKPAGTGDLLKALAAWGPFKQALDEFKAEVEKSVAQTTGGKATPRSVAFTIAGLGAAVATAQPIPIKPYLSITVDPMAKQGVVTLDIGKLARIPGFDGGPAPASASGPPGDPFGPGRF